MTNRMGVNGWGFAAVVLVALTSTTVDAQRVLNNNKLRFGDGAQASITTAGNLEQPWYNDPALGGGVDPSWYKLTFSNRFMEAAIGAGGDGTSTHNTNGTILTNAALTGQVIDDSGFVPTSGNVGYGTLVSTGTVAIAGTTLELQNTYRLGQNDKFIRVEFRVRNTGAAAATNLRYWVGTGDDWIGFTDSPTKERGNFVSGAFQMLSNPATPSQMIRIYSGQSGVLFYSTNPAVGTAINSCCNFNNIVNQNPATSAITLTNDGSYGIFMRFADLAPGDSALLVWYYAAAPFSELNALGGQVAAAAGSVVSYSPTVFAEAAANDGTISTTATITIAGDTFTGNDGDNFVAAGKATVSNVPAGLTPVLLRTSSTTATLAFSGTALSANNADDVGNLTVTFANTAFTGNDATALAGSNKSDLKIDFMDGGNTAPTGLGDLTLAAVAEDTASPPGEAINALSGLAFADVDAGDTLGGVAVVSNSASAATEGRWQYSSDAGVTWADIGTVGANSALSLSATTRVRFRPVADFNGAPTALVVRAMDNNASSFSVSTAPESRALIDAGVNGGATFISAATNTIGTTITAVNDAPTVAGPGSISVTEDTARTLTGISVADVDAGSAAVSLAFSVPTASGTFTATSGGGVVVSGSGTRTLALAGTITAINAFVAGGGVTYTPAADATGNVTLTLVADDGGNTGSGGALTGSRTVTLAIAAVNDAPQLTLPMSLVATPSVAIPVGGVVVSDVDAGAGSLTMSVGVPSGALQATSGAGVTVGGTPTALTLSGTLASLNAFLAANGLTFTAVSEAALSMSVDVNDNGNTGSGGARTASGTIAIQAQPVVLAPFSAREDRFHVRQNAGPFSFDVLRNDLFGSGDLSGGQLLLTDPPTVGSVQIDTAGTSDTVADDRFIVRLPNDFVGAVAFGYRLCDRHQRCDEAAVQIIVGAIASSGFDLSVLSNGGFRDLRFEGLESLTSARFETTPLIAPEEYIAALPARARPQGHDFAFEGSTRFFSPISGGASGRTWRLLVDARSLDGGDVDLYVGVSRHGAVGARIEDVQCVSATGVGSERCVVEITLASGEVAHAWAHVTHPAGEPLLARVEAFRIGDLSSDGTLMASGPGTVSRGEAFDVRLAWHASDFPDRSTRAGFIRIHAREGRDLGWIPVRLDRRGAEDTAIPVASGESRQFILSAGAAYRRMFIDVPPGTSRLEVRADSPFGVELGLSRVDAPEPSTVVPEVPAAPTRFDVTGQRVGSRDVASVDQPAPGRWYIVVRNATIEPSNPVVAVTLQAEANAPRAGGYFNPMRPGSGLFLYPAGNDWAGLWYAFDQGGRPTWYYLQAARPSRSGIWRSRIYRSSWDGERNALVRVGDATATPRDAGGFTFTYTLDGQTGSEAYRDFGGGCPTVGGIRWDVSGHWFDPSRPGTGFSAQMFGNYEFFTLFLYDASGRPVSLSAEQAGIGQASASLTLSQLSGPCPLCDGAGGVTRRAVGSFTRHVSGGRFASVDIDATFLPPLLGRWSTQNTVVPLGALQGCPAN